MSVLLLVLLGFLLFGSGTYCGYRSGCFAGRRFGGGLGLILLVLLVLFIFGSFGGYYHGYG